MRRDGDGPARALVQYFVPACRSVIYGERGSPNGTELFQYRASRAGKYRSEPPFGADRNIDCLPL
jgi:hypothetical protein